MAEKMNILSWNVNGIRASIKKGFYEKIKDLNPDIFCIQETKAQKDILAEIALELPDYKWYVNSAMKKGYSGTAIFTKREPLSHSYKMDIEEHDQEGRLISLEFDQFYLVNTYVPNSGQGLKRLDYRKTWDEALLSYLNQLISEKPVIFTGDLNVAHEPMDLARPKQNYNKTAGYTQVEIDGFKNLIAAGFIDTFRYFHKDRVQYTFWNQRFNAREKNVGWRIDYFLVSENFISNVRDSMILDQIFGSDHCPIQLTVAL